MGIDDINVTHGRIHSVGILDNSSMTKTDCENVYCYSYNEKIPSDYLCLLIPFITSGTVELVGKWNIASVNWPIVYSFNV